MSEIAQFCELSKNPEQMDIGHCVLSQPDTLNYALEKGLLSQEEYNRKNYKTEGEDKVLGIKGAIGCFDGVGGNGAEAAELAKSFCATKILEMPQPTTKTKVKEYITAILVELKTQIQQLKIKNNNTQLDTTLALVIPFIHNDGIKYIVSVSIGDSSIFSFDKDGSGYNLLNTHDSVGAGDKTAQLALMNLTSEPDINDTSEANQLLSMQWNMRNIITMAAGSIDSKSLEHKIRFDEYDPSKLLIVMTDGVTDNLTINYLARIIAVHSKDGASALARAIATAARNIMIGNGEVAKSHSFRAKVDDIAVEVLTPS